MATYAYYPEMKEVKPDHRFYDMESKPSYDWKYFYIQTPIELKGRGITYIKQIKASDYHFPARVAYKEGWHEYKVTQRAYDKLESQYRIVREALLD